MSSSIKCLTFVSFQASAAVWTIPAFLWDFTQRRQVVCCRRFGRTYRSHFHVSSGPRHARTLKMVTIVCVETSVTNYPPTLHEIPEERRSHLSYFYSVVTQLQLSSLILIQVPDTKFHKNPSSGRQVVLCRRTKRQDRYGEANSGFSQHSKAPKQAIDVSNDFISLVH